MVYAGDGSSTFGTNFTLNYKGGSSDILQFTGMNWFQFPSMNWGTIRTAYHHTNYTSLVNWNVTSLFQSSISVPSNVPLQSITLPVTTDSTSRMHIFALSITPSIVPPAVSGPALSVQSAQFSTRWETVGSQSAQAVAVTLVNLLPASYANVVNATVNEQYTIEVSGDGVETVTPGVFYRLVPSDQVITDVLVANNGGTGNATVTIKNAAGDVAGTSEGWPIVPLRSSWTADASVLSTHETPTWWRQAKFGIFTHWGVYSVPAYGPPSSYAEWYDWYLHNPNNSDSPTWVHHKEVYGPDVVYDDFIANFTATLFNASAWLDLFTNAGAKYFVQVTKHHDGYALFDTQNTSHRSSVYLNPYHDFLKELMDTAKSDYPDLHRGTYFSMPEWFNPYYAKYGFGEWPGGLAHNAYNWSEIEPYTGLLNVSDFLEDIQYPQMLSLALDYDTEIMWCDIGGPNMTIDFAAQFYNHAWENGYQVTMNDRCGNVPDFSTPEYAVFGSIQTRSWETNEGMDPFSYGINNQTTPDEYKNGTTIIQTLVDVVSKNGNYLLDVGPTAEGVIIPAMADNLLDAGRWLSYAGDCVYDTQYWYQAQQSPDGTFRFLTTPTTFCIVAFTKPTGANLTVDAGPGVVLPVLEGDTVRLLGPGGNGTALKWSVDDNGVMSIELNEDEVDAVDYAWAFQVEYAYASSAPSANAHLASLPISMLNSYTTLPQTVSVGYSETLGYSGAPQTAYPTSSTL
ncbi:glycoside hydrolase family 29 protein [Coniophora puteana RWD-64-598 SS2]|uniref:alpha-L-fucosidase n=1 Tax=Coniophora puteana (strain RWD-64-598) TaxID=741705 RepID=A0A5M3MMJ0_CONPW|nr:glycoside hydrolase family 29 protein [Coniophora puteana RWD-64-598 SS2]EIW80256.1 glycoside hydrolase family 29 protein [Coniophora puteana RWD-64-598 SS2]